MASLPVAWEGRAVEGGWGGEEREMGWGGEVGRGMGVELSGEPLSMAALHAPLTLSRAFLHTLQVQVTGVVWMGRRRVDQEVIGFKH